MSKFKNKLKQIKEKADILVISFCGYIGSAYMINANVSNPLMKGFAYLIFLGFFLFFTGTIISMLDLKYIGKNMMAK